MSSLKSKLSVGATKRRKSNKPNFSVIAAYSGVFVVLATIISQGYQPPKPANTVASVTSSSSVATQTITPTPEVSKSSIDELVATNVAANIAEQSDMAVSPILLNIEVDLKIKKSLDQTNDDTIVKPEISQIDDSVTDITTYLVKQGDTLDAIASMFNISVQTLKWANNITGDSVEPGKMLTIPPTDGVVYTVKSGDSIDNLASTYKANRDRIVSLNNLEISGLVPGSKIMIPNGDLPENQRPGYVAPKPVSQGVSWGYARGYSGGSVQIINPYNGWIPAGVNIYATSARAGYQGNCTWYAFFRRAQIGRPIPNAPLGNASSWAASLASYGYAVNRSPAVGAIIQNGGGLGHVGVVEQVFADGSVQISEMNYWAAGGLYVVDLRTIPAHEVASFNYIH